MDLKKIFNFNFNAGGVTGLASLRPKPPSTIKNTRKLAGSALSHRDSSGRGQSKATAILASSALSRKSPSRKTQVKKLAHKN